MSEIFDIYHDESIEDAYWHGILLVPRSSRHALLDLLNQSREQNDYHHKLSFKDIPRSAKSNHAIPLTAKSWTTIGVAALQQQKFGKYQPNVFVGMNPRKGKPAKYLGLEKLLKCKYAIFRERDKHRKMDSDPLASIEITFKIALKGALHYLFDNVSPITIGNIYIDGDEHYRGLYGRTLDGRKILDKLRREAREYLIIPPDSQIIPHQSDHRKVADSLDQQNSHLLQLCDILLGGIRFHAYCPDRKHIRYKISEPCKGLLMRDRSNFARMKQSRFFCGFSLSEAWLENNEWCFRQIEIKDTSGDANQQLPLDFS
jgi:hypothetical protein